MKYSVNIHPFAQFDFDTIFGYIADRTSEGAGRWADAFDDAIGELETDPYVFGQAPEELVYGRELKQKLFGTKSGNTYRAIFIIEDEVVTILRIRGEGQQLLTKHDFPPS